MNKKINLDQTVFLLLYYKYREYIFPFIVIISCLIIFFQFIMPQIQDWFTLQDQISITSEQIDTLSQNVKILSNIDDKRLDSLLTTAKTALPGQKDFAGILNAISSAASIAGVTLGDYSFQVGSIQGNGTQTYSGQLSVQVQLTISGGIEEAKSFIAALHTQFPLSNVTGLVINSSTLTSVTANFYYSPFPMTSFDETKPVQTITKADEDFLNQLAIAKQVQITPVATEEAKPLGTL
ncbi:MAG TPA: hypothetical protein VGT05_00750 [Patescibacteria group bacterium]|nr:hypothetical protein [Patescibacteria group bacterium]